ncbi:hypothetical protein HWV62_39946 [Athelia sp. TMB]|nr:hypothetical protein HWV62_39946 [Athelia sp. TMB]
MSDGHLGSNGHRATALYGQDKRNKQKKHSECRRRRPREIGRLMRRARAMGSVNGVNGEEDVDVDAHAESGGQFFKDFFSDPSQGPIQSTMDDSDNEAEPAAPAIPVTQATDILDLEWQKSPQAIVLNPHDERDKYHRATVLAEPEHPKLRKASHLRLKQQMPRDTEREELADPQKEEDERGLTMDPLMDKERAQEDADMRVSSAVKAQIRGLEKKREAAKKAKS